MPYRKGKWIGAEMGNAVAEAANLSTSAYTRQRGFNFPGSMKATKSLL